MRENVFLAGAAKGNITPKEEWLPLPYFGDVEMNRIDDDLHIRVLAMQLNDQKHLFISFDMVVVPFSEQLMQLIWEKLGIPKENIFMTATHSHTTPIVMLGILTENDKKDLFLEWLEIIKDVLIQTIERAMTRMQPAKIGYGTGKSYINVNRDEIKHGNKAELGNNYERPSDKTMYLVRLEDLNGQTIALIVNYAVHAVVMNGCLIDGGVAVSGDIAGRSSSLMEEKLGKDSVVLWTSGAAGDQNPRIMSNFGMQLVDGEMKLVNLGEGGLVVLQALSEEHVRNIIAANDAITCDECPEDLQSYTEQVSCAGRNNDFFKSENGEPKDIQYEIRVLKIGNVLYQGVSAEVVTSLGKSIRESSPYDETIFVTHVTTTNGYIPDDWEYEHESFEAEGTLVAQGAALPALLEGFRKLYDRIHS